MKSKMNLHTCNFEYLQADQPGHLGGGRAFLFQKEDHCKTSLKKTRNSWISKQFLWKGKRTQFFKLRLILRCWGKSSILCQQNSDAL